eukprot:TRINITY_DN11026_c0_g2_i1.p1 TRINITY_DN11026_c0_g2~~TRINITY_DN11026_c0_g2_i1.p1  ORF type:complete len:132 (-),score=8.60 TRINITY_DN11026_c0_g2_i1:10-405(-)
MWRKNENLSEEHMYECLNSHLATRRFIAANMFTIADIAILAWLLRNDTLRRIDSEEDSKEGLLPPRSSFDRLTHLRRWYGNCNSRPAIQRGHDLNQFEWLRSPRRSASAISEIGRAVQQECRDRSRMPSSA